MTQKSEDLSYKAAESCNNTHSWYHLYNITMMIKYRGAGAGIIYSQERSLHNTWSKETIWKT